MPDDTKQAGQVETTGANGAAEGGREPPQVRAPDGIPQEQFDAMRFIYDNWESGIFHLSSRRQKPARRIAPARR